MSVADPKFSDKMVRGDETLRDIAWAYARDYRGDWEVMLAAHELAMETNELPVPIARMVLNVMRADPAAHHLLPKEVPLTGQVIQLEDFRKNPEPPPRKSRGGKNQMPSTPKYAYPRVVSLRWHMRYAISLHKMARVAHILRTTPPMDRRGDSQMGYTNIRWVPRTQSYDVCIKVWCGRNWISWRYQYSSYRGEEPNYIDGINRMGVVLTNDPQDYPVCEPCKFRETRFAEIQNGE